MARWLVVGALAGFGLLVGAQVAQAQTGPTVHAAPESADFEGETDADAAQDGDNDGSVNQGGTGSSGDPVAGAQVTGVVAGEGASVDATNTADDPEATSGDVEIDNRVGTLHAGPKVGQSADPNATDFEGDVDAVVAQDGDNEVELTQDAQGTSGDAVAGVQVLGMVTEGGVSVISQENTADGPEATSGDVETANHVTSTSAGPVVFTDTARAEGGDFGAGATQAGSPVTGTQAVLPPPGGVQARQFEGPVTATVAQSGDNGVSVAQNTDSRSGDAVAGGQVTGLVTSEAGSVSVVNQQSSEDADAVSGDSEASNSIGNAHAGPLAVLSESTDGATAGVVQEGDNDLSGTQTGASDTGDAVAGAQVTGAVADGDLSVTQVNTSEDADATSGSSEVANEAATLGPGACDDCEAPAGSLIAGPVLAIDGSVSEGDEAFVTQDGDNTVDHAQAGSAGSGDAVAGGQVIGSVAGGDVSVDAANTSEDGTAESGETSVSNDAAHIAGGDTAACDACETAAGSIIAGPFVSTSSSIDGDVTLTQDGDNDLAFGQAGVASSGDAVAGGQVAGSVADGDASIALDNTSEDDEAESGESSVANVAAKIDTPGDDQGCDNCESVAGSLIAGPFVSTSSSTNEPVTLTQDGDNDLAFGQAGVASSGDAVAGGQVAGSVAGGDISAVLDNTSADAEAASGGSTVENQAARIETSGDTGIDQACNNCNSAAGSLLAGPFVSSESSTNEPVTLTQDGDNDLAFGQAGVASSGDAVAGGQVAGSVAGGDAALDAANASEDADATSGDGEVIGSAATIEASGGDEGESDQACNNCDSIAGSIKAGPFVSADSSINDDVTLTQDGANDLAASQDGVAASGDAVAGGQVAGSVAEGDVSVVLENTSEDDQATSGEGTVEQNAATIENGSGDDACNNCESMAGTIHAGPFVSTESSISGDATVALTQDGANDLSFGQDGVSSSGDAVAGGQVAGSVAGGDAALEAINASEDADATSGDGEVTGSAARVASSSDEDEACNNCDSTAASLLAGPYVSTGGSIDGDVTLTQDGSNDLAFGQSGDANSGDAVAGGQVAGSVASGNVSVALDNTSEDDEATSGENSVANTAASIETSGTEDACNNCESAAGSVHAGPYVSAASSISGEVTLTQDGDNDLSFGQDGVSSSGDAVAGGQVAGSVASGDVSAVLDNTSQDAEATSGGSAVENTAATIESTAESDSDQACDDCESLAGSVHAGPFVSTESSIDDSVTLAQEGDNDLGFAQDGVSSSGDAVAGGQVAGSVAGGDVSLEAGNASEDAVAVSGDTEIIGSAARALVDDSDACDECASVAASVVAGPFVSTASSIDDPVTLTQDGDNDLAVSQDGVASSGDAVAGGQVAGSVADGDVSLALENASEDDEASSGASAVVNSAATIEGTGTSGAAGCENCDSAAGSLVAGPFVSTDNSIDDPVTLTQDGDNDLAVSQDGVASSGDAVAGGQVAGSVADGDVSAVLDNASEDADATSGESAVENSAAILSAAGAEGTIDACDGCESLAGSLQSGPFVASGSSIDGDVTLTQDGDNDLSLGQDGVSSSGDAVAGGQVAGSVAGGDVFLDAANVSEDADATSGDSEVVGSAARLLNDNQEVCDDCESAAGIVHAGPFVSTDSSIDDPVTLTQDGDNDLAVSQDGVASSGDAVAGGQVTGSVAEADVSAVLDNTSQDDEAESGASTVANAAATVESTGDSSSENACENCDSATGSILAGPFISAASSIDDPVTLTQEGDNDLSFGQAGDASSGDAVAGGQVTGSVSGGSVDLEAANVSEDADATSGDGEVTGSAGRVLNDATNTCDDCDSVAGSIIAGPWVSAASSIDDPVTLTQEGDNDLSFGQAGDASSGDAVAGGQVAGSVASGDVSAVLENTSSDDEATSGETGVENTAATIEASVDDSACDPCESIAGSLVAGPFISAASSIDDPVTLTQEGDNDLGLAQDGVSSSGDAVAGGQVAGSVAGGATSIDATNVAEDADSATGDTDVANTAGGIFEDGLSEACDDCESAAGNVLVGPLLTAGDAITGDASIFQDGDNDLGTAQTFDAGSGDAVSGGQVIGVVSGGPVTIVQSNTATDVASDGGSSSAESALVGALVGPIFAEGVEEGLSSAFAA